jgi:hypothetical protein
VRACHSRPQQATTGLDDRAAHAKKGPAAIATALFVPRLTGVMPGRTVEFVNPLPLWPYRLSPQHRTCPVAPISAQAKASPVAMAVAPVSSSPLVFLTFF